MTIRVLAVFGTRPEAIKMAPVVRALRARTPAIEAQVCLTAQHREMLDQVMRSLDLEADFDLDLMRAAQSPCDVASRVFAELPRILQEVHPDMVIVQGDTTTTMAAALTAFMSRIPVSHVEAGLRTRDLTQPFPEEMNRRVVSQVTELHFAPTRRARDALLAEGIPANRIHLTGNTVVDALLRSVRANYAFESPSLASLPAGSPLILVTVHRRESFGRPLEGICGAVADVAREFADHLIVLPVHPNPNVADVVRRHLGDLKNVVLTEPLAYLDFIHLMERSRLILTDSGGVQEEAPSLGKPILVLREVTERPEGVEAGTARVVGTSPEVIRTAVRALLTDPKAYDSMAQAENPYGDGHAGERIADAILAWSATSPTANDDA